jgi:hypothetical protein
MKFQVTPTKLKNRWTYQAQFNQPKSLDSLKSWCRYGTTGEYELAGDSFYTNELQDIFQFRIQFDEQIRLIRQWKA